MIAMGQRGLNFFAIVMAIVMAGPSSASERKATRIDFDDAVIQGQTNRGAIHLIERKGSNLGSLVKTRRNFREHILAPYGLEAPSGLQLEKPLPDATRSRTTAPSDEGTPSEGTVRQGRRRPEKNERPKMVNRPARESRSKAAATSRGEKPQRKKHTVARNDE